ncbi:MAG TPA: DPP IV N-terminal domain-containing protein [Gemmataceae bacterium]|nr:DPP IV N-terminal domain-containing protein [Gemmataceae bacterium]
MNLRAISFVSFAALTLLAALSSELIGQDSLATVAEKSNYTKTSTHAQMLDFCTNLAKQSPLVRLSDMGETTEGRKLTLMIIADPPVATPEEAAKSGKMVVFAMGNIHAGEVDGKEAALAFARDVAMAKKHPLLKDLIIVIAPNFNADGGDKMGQNRKSQAGPKDVGVRHNSQNFDLNRDFVKLESPECQGLVRFFRQWDPAVVMDLHTTNGSNHQYTLTYDSPRHPSNELIRDFGRDVMLPDVSQRLQKFSGYKSFYYGNFGGAGGMGGMAGGEPSSWTTTPAEPRYGFHYQGFRNRIGILSESYSYAPYRDRVLASYGFVKTCFEFAADNKDKINKLLADADKANTDPPAGAMVALRHKSVPLPGKTTVLGVKGARTIEEGGKSVEYKLDVVYKTEATLSVSRPFAYLIPPTFTKAIQNLQHHGVDVEELREDIDLDVEAYKIDSVKAAKGNQAGYGMHNLISLEAKARKESRKIKAGTIVVRTNQKLGTLASFWLEPQSEDGLATWNFFDSGIKEGGDFPVLRLPAKAAMNLIKAKTPANEQGPKKKITLEMIDNGTVPNFLGDPAKIEWMEDGDYFLQVKDGVLCKVHAVSGRSVPYTGTDLDIFDDLVAASGGPFQKQKGKGKAGKGGHEIESQAPGGKYNAFVRNNNLYVEDVASKKERALTTDGSEAVFNGKNDWVYMEEVVGRGNRKHYWWSSTGEHLAFIRLDDSPVPKATVVDFTKFQPTTEAERYPNAGDPNPLVKFAIASAAPVPISSELLRAQELVAKLEAEILFFKQKRPDLVTSKDKSYLQILENLEGQKALLAAAQSKGASDVNWVDLSAYEKDKGFIISRVGWLPGGKTCWFAVMDRSQTWCDICTVGLEGGKPTKLFRDTTKAWVEYPKAPTWLADGTFLFLSERTGWRHIYHYSKDGKLLADVTKGDWEVSTVSRVDEKTGYVYFSGNKDGGNNAWKVKLDGTDMQKVTKGGGDHEVQYNSRGDMYVDTVTEWDVPATVTLHKANGTLIRVLDTNPVYIREEFQKGGTQLVSIKTRDGWPIQATVAKPSNFDANKKYPVWVKTYGGPRMPQIKGGGKGGDAAFTDAGYIVMHVDPRSASNKGAISAWACYKQLGVSELSDIEDAVKWITANSWADSKRVGISGHSYGGFMAAFALTHSKLFAAGIAGAPPTDWHNYDSIYTERYMQTPQMNPNGYDITSCVKAAKNTTGRLLLAHGLKDDNVHAGNSIQLAHALQQANKVFDIQLYPLSRHGISGAHYTGLQRDFMKAHLKPGT